MITGYPGYPGYPSYVSGEKSYLPPGPPHLLSLLSPEALTDLLETIKTGGGLGAVSRMGAGGRCPLGPKPAISLLFQTAWRK